MYSMLSDILSTAMAFGAAIGVFIVSVPIALVGAGLSILALISPFLLGNFLSRNAPKIGRLYQAVVVIPLVVLHTIFELLYGATVILGIGGILLAIPVFLLFAVLDSVLDVRFWDLYLTATAILIFYFRKVIATFMSERFKDNFNAFIFE